MINWNARDDAAAAAAAAAVTAIVRPRLAASGACIVPALSWQASVELLLSVQTH